MCFMLLDSNFAVNFQQQQQQQQHSNEGHNFQQQHIENLFWPIFDFHIQKNLLSFLAGNNRVFQHPDFFDSVSFIISSLTEFFTSPCMAVNFAKSSKRRGKTAAVKQTPWVGTKRMYCSFGEGATKNPRDFTGDFIQTLVAKCFKKVAFLMHCHESISALNRWSQGSAQKNGVVCSKRS